jgi:hypothetical protein
VATTNASAGTCVPLADGTIAYYGRIVEGRADECFAAALATSLQVPIDDVPDSHLDERLAAGEDPDEITRPVWADIGEWLRGRRLRMLEHQRLPIHRRRWIGACPTPELFSDHCLVMSHGDLLFTPIPEAYGFLPFTPREIRWGMSFQAT